MYSAIRNHKVRCIDFKTAWWYSTPVPLYPSLNALFYALFKL